MYEFRIATGIFTQNLFFYWALNYTTRFKKRVPGSPTGHFCLNGRRDDRKWVRETRKMASNQDAWLVVKILRCCLFRFFHSFYYYCNYLTISISSPVFFYNCSWPLFRKTTNFTFSITSASWRKSFAKLKAKGFFGFSLQATGSSFNKQLFSWPVFLLRHVFWESADMEPNSAVPLLAMRWQCSRDLAEQYCLKFCHFLTRRSRFLARRYANKWSSTAGCRMGALCECRRVTVEQVVKTSVWLECFGAMRQKVFKTFWHPEWISVCVQLPLVDFYLL